MSVWYFCWLDSLFYRFPSYSSSSTRHRCSQQRTCSLKIQPPASCLNYQLCNVLFTRLISVSPIHLRMKVIPPSSRSAPGLNPRAWLIIDYLWGEKAFLPENVVISHTQVFRVTFIHAFIYFFIGSFLFVPLCSSRSELTLGGPIELHCVLMCLSWRFDIVMGDYSNKLFLRRGALAQTETLVKW